jgi:hypothetical protein
MITPTIINNSVLLLDPLKVLFFVSTSAIGAHDLFKKYLNEYELPDALIQPFKATLELTYNTLNSETKQEDVLLKIQLDKQEAELKKLIRKSMIEDDFDKAIFKELKTEYETQISILKLKLNYG